MPQLRSLTFRHLDSLIAIQKEIINKEKVAEWCYISHGTELYSDYELFFNVEVSESWILFVQSSFHLFPSESEK